MQMHLVLSDDWELRGDGSGDMRELQFQTARRLMDVYEAHGLRGTFNVEVMQQLAHREHASRNPHLSELAVEWDECVREMYQRGHDVQLHVHAQWDNARYTAGKWQLQSKWLIIDHPEENVRRMLRACKAYLESLLQPLDKQYRCRSFRTGSWGIAPSPFILRLLADIGIVFDMSLCDGLEFDFPEATVDYRGLEEPLSPFYPCMHDARRVADQPTPIVCVPTHSRKAGIGRRLRQIASRIIKPLAGRWAPKFERSHLLTPMDVALGNGETATAYGKRRGQQRRSVLGARRGTLSHHVTTDLAALTYADARAALRDAMHRLEQMDAPVMPVIFENHTKCLGNWAPIERFCRLVTATPNLTVITAKELAMRFQANAYPIRCRSGDMPLPGALSRGVVDRAA